MKLHAKAGVAGVCLMGVEYANDSSGCIDVPADLVSVALANGYEPSLELPVLDRELPRTE